MTSLCRAGLASLVLLVAALGQHPDSLQLVKAAVANEVQATEHPPAAMMYRLTKESKSGTQVRDMIETKDGMIARVVSVDGRQLTPAERTADDQRLEYLAKNPSEQARKQADQQKEMARFLALIRALPDALLYTYDGTEQVDGRETVRLKFRPNPAFHTTSIETIIFHAAEGHIWIDPLEKRIAKFDGVQTSEINIGWGLLGHIDKGSKLQLEQHRLDDGQWRLNKLALQGSGKILLFKSVNMNQRQSATDFRVVPSNLSVAQAIDLLKKQEVKVASNKSL